ncbi:competence/damage-inducible protein A [Alkaliphilus peptidifermentans]|uniref:Putative competence-damage inducible protein n=1 Tax=Alkaliphilus peptidifermentans DSM 18978 TaxID=1120976 RepID=A0A1G5DBA8_9FIRM|nr:competence/damage-inducible protein A [Alkaliphilus peptidifermentans]SCY11894.1 nicotinamide-nucleotide amidase [Alkaliphilus peptidifermentans DSM 18978]
MKASIVCIGTELLKGKTIDTNSYFISQQLISHGFSVGTKLIVEDDLQSIINSITYALNNSDILIITGGLGPTLDDITREAVAEVTGCPLELNDDAKEHIVEILSRRHKRCPANNFRQAYFPKGASIIENENGTAPGFLIEYKFKKIYVLPGPPFEMQAMLTSYVMPSLKYLSSKSIIIKSFEVIGIGESALEDELMDLIQKYNNLSVATYALDGNITLTVTAEGESEDFCREEMEPLLREIQARIGNYIYSHDGSTLEEEVYKILKEKNLRLSTAESCTGGMLAAKLTSVAGISEVFESGFITYSNESKTRDLSISPELINSFGAVSKEVALAMVKGLKSRTNSQCCISITGIAGPKGGTPEKPVGTVFIGINVIDEFEVVHLQLYGKRERIQKLSTITALNLLRKKIMKEV